MVGVAVHMPRERRRGQRPSDVLLARVCAVIDLLIESGMSEEGAAQAMARRMIAAGVSAPRQGRHATAWQSLVEWRSHLSEGLASEDAKWAYWVFAHEIDELPTRNKLQRVLDDQLWNRRRRNRGRVAMHDLAGRFAENQSGATAIEYGLIALGISVAIVTTVGLIGGQLNTVFNTVVTLFTPK